MKQYALEKLYNGRYELVRSSSDLDELIKELVDRVINKKTPVRQRFYSHRIIRWDDNKIVMKYNANNI